MSEGKRLYTKSCDNKPELKISFLAWKKMEYITKHSKLNGSVVECTTLGIMSKTDPNLVVDVYVPKQFNTGSSTDADSKDVMNWVERLIEDGIDPQQLSFWHHSHAHHGVFWSNTDLSTMSRFATDNVLWSVVTNLKGEMLARADIFQPCRYWWDDCEVTIQYPEISGLDEWFKEAIPKMSSPPVITMIPKKTQPKTVHQQHQGPNRHREFFGRSGGFEQAYADWWENQNGFADAVAAETADTEDDRDEYVYFYDNIICDAYDESILSKEEATELDDLLWGNKITLMDLLFHLLESCGTDKEKLISLEEIVAKNYEQLGIFEEEAWFQAFKDIDIELSLDEASEELNDTEKRKLEATKKLQREQAVEEAKKHAENKNEKQDTKTKPEKVN